MVVVFDKELYSFVAIQKSAYRFIDRLTVDFKQNDNEIKCSIKLVNENNNLDKIVDDFKREVLDQELREKIKGETESVRNLILSYAFSRTGLQQ